ncbi:hypothetical protein [Thalassospira australica]|uniref:hypothetical protein n=1 Tax=Thalassospira australica TaxID=1528106 RepID=UPI00384CE162
MLIGIDRNNGLFYEGQSYRGYGVWPKPVISNARFVYPTTKINADDPASLGGCFFREDTFDPVSRIRRGRFYFEGSSQPAQWTVEPHPALTSELREKAHLTLKKELDTYYARPISDRYLANRSERPVVWLGIEERFTIWNIVDVEAIHTGEDLVTLRSCSRFGILPEVSEAKVDKDYRAPLNEMLNYVADDLFKSSAPSVVDRAREAISQILLTHYKATAENAKDLSKMINELEREKRIIAASAAKIVARLHARAKPVERKARDLPPIRRQDAELAVQCVGVVLCELGFAEWP